MTESELPRFKNVALVNENLTVPAFHALAGKLAGVEFVKVVVERSSKKVHFINEARYRFHSDYIAEQILGVTSQSIDDQIDSFNQSVYLSPDRQYYIATLTLHDHNAVTNKPFFALQTVEIDNMGADIMIDMVNAVRRFLDQTFSLFFRPASYEQEKTVAQVSIADLPRVYNHEIFSNAKYIALNPGQARGRLRMFYSLEDYQKARSSLCWYDILVLPKVPDDVPRVSGLIHGEKTTPLSHTNVLAHGWGIPNAYRSQIVDFIEQNSLNEQWVYYNVDFENTDVVLTPIDAPTTLESPPWSIHNVHVDAPMTSDQKIQRLDSLRATDRERFGTKAANLGELEHLLSKGSERILGYYRIPRPPRENLLSHLQQRLLTKGYDIPLQTAAHNFMKSTVSTLPGIAIPFGLSILFFESSPAIQQALGRLKLAIELRLPQLDSLAIELCRQIKKAKLPDAIRDSIDSQIAKELAGVKSFVVRSSSNAEDLEGFSAAGVYESVTHVTTRESLFESIKTVWASLFTPRAVRLRADVGISVEQACMGVIIQQELDTQGKQSMGGVLVTTNPMAPRDFRDVYFNISLRSVGNIVTGTETPIQLLCNTVEGGSHTLALGNEGSNLSNAMESSLEDLSITGRFIQSHFAPDYTFSAPLDIEWAWLENKTYLLQVRPYAG